MGPSGANFRALEPGELFLFKLHAPRNYIVGSGVFAHAMTLPCSLAWEAFGEANGAADLAQMRGRIMRYRKVDPNDRSDFPIGCRVLTQVFFKSEEAWLPAPASFSKNVVTFKTYSTDSDEGQRLWEWANGRMIQSATGFAEEAQRFGQPTRLSDRDSVRAPFGWLSQTPINEDAP